MIKLFQLICFLYISSIFSESPKWVTDQILEIHSKESSQIHHSVSSEVEIKGYIEQNWDDWSGDEQRDFEKSMTLFYKENPQSKLIPIISRTIGDGYYRQKKTRKMVKWYRRAVEHNPDIAKKTTVGYRLKKAKEEIFWENCKILIYSLQGILILSVLFTLIKKRADLDMALLMKRILIILPSYIVLTLAVFVVDFLFFKQPLFEYLTFTKTGVTVPIVVLNILDSSNIGFGLLLVSFSILPIILAIFLSSYKKRSKTFAFFALLQIIVLGISIWAHFLINTLVTNEQKDRATFYNYHLIFPGEIEELFLEHPQKVIKANPEFLHSDNKDLKIFIDEYYPELYLKRED